jgi:hypothetical protein
MALTMSDIVKLHIEKFGVEPIMTGETFLSGEPIEVLIYKAILEGVPYQESPMPSGLYI